jgi:SAM-dependent methyltransferase
MAGNKKAQMKQLLFKAWQKLVAQGPMAVIRAGQEYVTDLRRNRLDRRLDRRYGIQTCGIDDNLSGLGATGEHQVHGFAYEPIQLNVFSDILKSLPIAPNDYCFIDFGSGKGRALILAAEAGFKSVVGIEFAPALHAVARSNVSIYQQQCPGSVPIETHCQDATTFVLPVCDAVLFFYNPFDDVVMRKMLNRIELSWRARKRNLIVVYRNPVYSDIFDNAAFLQTVVTNRAFRVYRTV